MRARFLVGALAGLFFVTAADAAVISYTDSYTLDKTNWNTTLELSQFDSTLGTLTGITISYSGDVESSFLVESMDAQASTVTATANALITFSNSLFNSLNLNIQGADNTQLGAFDGSIDFGGTSGFDFGTIAASNADSITLNAANVSFADFIGTGTFLVNVSAIGSSFVTGAGNLISQINTLAAASIKVSYHYNTVTVPAPATLGLFALGLLAVGAARRSKKQ